MPRIGPRRASASQFGSPASTNAAASTNPASPAPFVDPRDANGLIRARHATALRTAAEGRAARVAKLAGLNPRSVQHWIEPQSDQEGPGAKFERLVRALRADGAPEWHRPIEALVEAFGFGLIPRSAADEVLDELAAAVERLREHHRAEAYAKSQGGRR